MTAAPSLHRRSPPPVPRGLPPLSAAQRRCLWRIAEYGGLPPDGPGGYDGLHPRPHVEHITRRTAGGLIALGLAVECASDGRLRLTRAGADWIRARPTPGLVLHADAVAGAADQEGLDHGDQ
jgi:hypothetical protein